MVNDRFQQTYQLLNYVAEYQSQTPWTVCFKEILRNCQWKLNFEKHEVILERVHIC